MRRLLIGPILSVVALAMMLAIATPIVRADPRDFTLINSSDVTFYYVYVSSSNTSDWEEDLLGSDVLLAGSSVNITFSRFQPGQCSYDIKVVAADGREGYLWAVDLCTTTTVTFR